MANDDSEYELLPHKEILEIKRELKKLKSGDGEMPSSHSSIEMSMNRLAESIDALIDIFKTSSDDMKLEHHDEKMLLERITPLLEKFGTVIDQNEKIAKGIVAVADMVKSMPKPEEKPKFVPPIMPPPFQQQQMQPPSFTPPQQFQPPMQQQFAQPNQPMAPPSGLGPSAIPPPSPFSNTPPPPKPEAPLPSQGLDMSMPPPPGPKPSAPEPAGLDASMPDLDAAMPPPPPPRGAPDLNIDDTFPGGDDKKGFFNKFKK